MTSSHEWARMGWQALRPAMTMLLIAVLVTTFTAIAARAQDTSAVTIGWRLNSGVPVTLRIGKLMTVDGVGLQMRDEFDVVLRRAPVVPGVPDRSVVDVEIVKDRFSATPESLPTVVKWTDVNPSTRSRVRLSEQGEWDSLVSREDNSFSSTSVVARLTAAAPFYFPSSPLRRGDTWPVKLFANGSHPSMGKWWSQFDGHARLDSVSGAGRPRVAWVTVTGTMTESGRDSSRTTVKSVILWNLDEGLPLQATTERSGLFVVSPNEFAATSKEYQVHVRSILERVQPDSGTAAVP